MFKYFLMTVLFFITLSVLWWAYMPSRTPNDRNIKLTTIETPDSYMDHITFYDFNKSGKLQKKITSTHAVHFNKHNRLTYNKPYIAVYPATGGAWQIQSDKGQSIDGTNVIELINNVIIHRKPSNSNPETTAKTSRLKAFPKKDLLSTDQFVSIKQPHLLINGIGMKGNLKTGELKTLANTKTIYSPKA